jgi:hypothetical protein
MANKRSLHYDVGGGEAVEQPVLLTVPGSSPAGTSAAGEQGTGSGQSLRVEWAKQLGLAGVAEARAALAAAARRAEAERAAARAAGRAA